MLSARYNLDALNHYNLAHFYSKLDHIHDAVRHIDTARALATSDDTLKIIHELSERIRSEEQ
jgi:hypothetical protein